MYVHGSLKEEATLASHVVKSTFHRPLCSSGRWRGFLLEESGFVTKATCWAGQPVVRQEKSLWWTQVLGCPLAFPSVSVSLLAGHLYNCNFTQAKKHRHVKRGDYAGACLRPCVVSVKNSLSGAEWPLKEQSSWMEKIIASKHSASQEVRLIRWTHECDFWHLWKMLPRYSRHGLWPWERTGLSDWMSFRIFNMLWYSCKLHVNWCSSKQQ